MPALRRFLAGLLCAGALAISASVRAEERINDYRVDIRVMENGILDVAEEIEVTSEGIQITHGIYRDIPLAFIAADGHRAWSGLTVIDVERDGEPETYKTTGNSRGEVVWIGNSDVELAAGEHRYRIHYSVDRAVSYFGDHDRLAWNVNGPEWRFPIDALSARVELPEGVAPLSIDVHTGSFGEDGKDVTVKKSGNVIMFTATRPYAVGENMTIGFQLPKGAIRPPDEKQLNEWWYRDYGSIVYGAGIAAFGAISAMLLWFLFGRDPRPGVIVPRWDPPGGLSPGQVDYIVSRNVEEGSWYVEGFWKAFSASILDLAVKGQVVLENLVDGMTLRKVASETDSSLPEAQAAIMRSLPDTGESFRFDKANATATQALGEAFRDAVVSEGGQDFHQPNGWVWMSFCGVMFVVWQLYDLNCAIGGEYPPFCPLPFHALFAVAPWFLVFEAVKTWRRSLFWPRPASGRDCVKIAAYLCAAFAALCFFAGLVFADEPTLRDSFLLASALSVVGILLSAFVGRMSREGREVMDGIAGLTLYLELAEKNRMALTAAPNMSPAHYEKLLPYAVALGVEKAWSRHFETALAAARASGEDWNYHSAWYLGGDAGDFDRISEISAFSSGIASSIEKTLPSVGGSGAFGSSGCGRGGGGVGGW